MSEIETNLFAQLSRAEINSYFEHAFRHARDIMLLLGEDSRILECNAAAVTAYGYRREELLRLDIGALQAPESLATLEQRQKISWRPEGGRFEAVHRRKDGSTFPVEVNSNPLAAGNQNIRLSVIRDMSEHRRLVQEREQYFRFFNLATDPMCIADPFGCFKQVNPAFTKLTGFAASELVAKPFLEFVLPEDRQRTAEEMKLQVETRPSLQFENRYVCKDGGHIHLSWNAHFDKSDGVTYATAHDITARKRMASAVERERTRLRSILSMASDGIHIMDSDGVLVDASDSFLKMLGYDSTAIGRLRIPDWDAQIAPEKIKEIVDEVIQRQDQRVFETRHRRSDGRLLDVEINLAGIEIEGRGYLYASARDITLRKSAEEEIKYLAFYDPLTNLPNRRLLLDRLQQALTGSARHQRYGALLLLDMDDFKTLNDTLGHDVGDGFLVAMAGRLQACVRKGDTVSRQGGDEFVVILEDLNENELAAMQAESIAVKMLRVIAEPYEIRTTARDARTKRSYQTSASIGIALFRGNAISVEELMKRADTAMYQAKTAGRNTLRFFDPAMQAAVNARAAMEADLREALREGQFMLYYQPQIGEGRRWIGAEALIRWQHPLRGLTFPTDFISLAEETGLILPIGHWVLQTACEQLVAWAASPQTAHLTLAVNTSARQFHHPDFVEHVLAALDQTGADPRKLKLELTESLLLDDMEDIIAKMSLLKAKGVGFSLDDFGTGYSSLSYLKRLPLDQLKIDQSFVRDILFDANDAAIARTIVALAQSMGLGIIAEGVESEDQREFLASLGCGSYQGYLFGRAVPAEEFGRLLKPGR